MKRVVSLVPSLTLTMSDLGRADWLVGVTRYCEEPAELVASLPKVGGTKNPKLEEVAALEPDLVLVNTEENRVEDIAWLRERFDVHESMPRTVRESAAMVRSLGERLDCREAAAGIVASIDEVLAAATGGSAPPRVFYPIWQKPWMSVNADTYIHDVIAVAGGANVTADRTDRYPTLTTDELQGLRADVVLLPSEPFPFETRHRDELVAAGTFGSTHVRLVDGRDYCWHGSRTAAGVSRARALLREFRSRR